MKKNSLLSIIITITAIICFGYYAFEAGKYIAIYCYPLRDKMEFFDIITHLGILLLALVKYVFIFAFISFAMCFIFQLKKEFSDSGEYISENDSDIPKNNID